jgi:hydroxyethylthiazole kinase
MQVYKILEKVRSQKPLVHHLTNWVTIYDCANIVKVFGASPVMAHSKNESAEMASIASSLVLNIGTLTNELIDSMKLATKTANKKSIPVILDTCGAGATKLRDNKCFELLNETKINVIKGNSSEVTRIAGYNVKTKGVDATEVKKNLIELAKELSKKRKCTVVITGKEDIIADNKLFLVKNGHKIMSNIVGTGCMATSVIGTFCAVEKDLAKASAAGLSCFGIAAEIAQKQSSGPGTFKEKLYDAVYNLNEKQVNEMQKVVEEKN